MAHSKAQRTMPAEFEPHAQVWTAWPAAADLWQENLAPAQAEVAALIAAIVDMDPQSGLARGERVSLLVANEEARQSAMAALGGVAAAVDYHVLPYGDIWLRDTGPIFFSAAKGLRAATFGFNGWGGKYCLPFDDKVAQRTATAAQISQEAHSWVFEGGSIDVDGTGLALTTEQCLLNPNRNPGLSRVQIEANLFEALGLTTLIWLGEGLVGDHTDGHIDNLARFVAPGVVAVPEAMDGDDPNKAIYAEALARLKAVKGLDVVTVPSIGLVTDEDGASLPATAMNFYIANTRVIVPTYGGRYEEEALAAIAALFPGRETLGLPARHILSGGGSFHCITQQQPCWPLSPLVPTGEGGD